MIDIFDEYIIELLNKLKISEELIGILVYGSYVLQTQDEFSDLDILIIVDNEYKNICGRGNFIIKDKSIEFFIKTENEIYKELIEELETLEPATRNELLSGIIIKDKYNAIKKMQERAREISQMPYKPLSRLEIEGITITLRNELREIERKNRHKEKDLLFCFYNYLYELIKAYCDYEKVPIRKYKFYKTYTNEKYRINNMQLDISDKYVKEEFINLIDEFDFEKLKELTEYILKKIGTLPIEYRIYRNKEEYYE